jgi:gamma-glutamylputrescine oxidase
MSKPDHIDSYYSATAQTLPDYPMLSESIECDVCVIGGGLTGLSAALELAERGYRAIVLEAARVGWGASGRNGGQASAAYACDMTLLQTLLGRDDARRLWDMSVAAVELIKQRIERYRIDCDLKPGVMLAALKPRQRSDLEQWQALAASEYAYPELQLLTGKALREQLDSPRYIAGLYDPQAVHLHPLNYTIGLARAATTAGALIFEDSPVQQVDQSIYPVAHTAAGQVRSRYLLFAGNAYLGRLQPRLSSTIMPVGTYMIATEPLGEARSRALIANDMAVADIQFVLDYYRLSADRRLLFGGKVSYSTLAPPHLRQLMRFDMLKVFPQLSDVAIDYAWGGHVAITMNRAPHFGRLAGNSYFAQGFSGHGLALTGLAGRLIAEAIAGNAERFDVFTRIRHRSFPGGRGLRTPLLVLAMAYYRLRDLL